jgi:septal ring factor EnvC (AmiA/AmiB activator)
MKKLNSVLKTNFTILLDTVSLIVLFLGLVLIFKSCSQNYETSVRDTKLDSIYSEINKLNTKVDSLQVQKKTLLVKEKTIHEEHLKTIERIILTADSSQHIITEELIREHKALDSAIK